MNGLTLRSFWNALPTPGRWLLSGTVFQVLGRGMALPFTVIYLHEVRGLGLSTATALMALIAASALVLTPPFGALTDRWGARRTIILGSLAQVLGCVLLGFATSVPVVAAAMVCLGISQAGGFGAFNVMISSIVEGHIRQTFFGINFALVNLGIGVGGILGGLYVDVHNADTFTVVYLINAACMLIPVAIMLGPLRHVSGLSHATAKGGPGAAPASYLTILRRPGVLPAAILSLIFALIGYGQMEAGFPAFAREVSMVSTETLGWAFGVNTAVIVLGQFAVLRRIQGHRRTRVVMVMSVIWAGAWLLLGVTGLFPGGPAAAVTVIAFFAVFAAGETMLQPTLPAITNDLAQPHERGRYNALSNTAFQLGAVIAPLTAGLLLDHGQAGIYIGLLVLGCGAMIWTALVLERQITPLANGMRPTLPVPEPHP